MTSDYFYGFVALACIYSLLLFFALYQAARVGRFLPLAKLHSSISDVQAVSSLHTHLLLALFSFTGAVSALFYAFLERRWSPLSVSMFLEWAPQVLAFFIFARADAHWRLLAAPEHLASNFLQRMHLVVRRIYLMFLLIFFLGVASAIPAPTTTYTTIILAMSVSGMTLAAILQTTLFGVFTLVLSCKNQQPTATRTRAATAEVFSALFICLDVLGYLLLLFFIIQIGLALATTLVLLSLVLPLVPPSLAFLWSLAANLAMPFCVFGLYAPTVRYYAQRAKQIIDMLNAIAEREKNGGIPLGSHSTPGSGSEHDVDIVPPVKKTVVNTVKIPLSTGDAEVQVLSHLEQEARAGLRAPEPADLEYSAFSEQGPGRGREKSVSSILDDALNLAQRMMARTHSEHSGDAKGRTDSPKDKAHGAHGMASNSYLQRFNYPGKVHRKEHSDPMMAGLPSLGTFPSHDILPGLQVDPVDLRCGEAGATQQQQTPRSRSERSKSKTTSRSRSDHSKSKATTNATALAFDETASRPRAGSTSSKTSDPMRQTIMQQITSLRHVPRKSLADDHHNGSQAQEGSPRHAQDGNSVDQLLNGIMRLLKHGLRHVSTDNATEEQSLGHVVVAPVDSNPINHNGVASLSAPAGVSSDAIHDETTMHDGVAWLDPMRNDIAERLSQGLKHVQTRNLSEETPPSGHVVQHHHLSEERASKHVPPADNTSQHTQQRDEASGETELGNVLVEAENIHQQDVLVEAQDVNDPLPQRSTVETEMQQQQLQQQRRLEVEKEEEEEEEVWEEGVDENGEEIVMF
eukprot:gb/GEZN01002202.1/.p1 GENE.gb/GEZN01002202.1/~~gb/GEZN01002202.1/.p1  ORF type:complete len:814 (-),score=130.53 gb/GEZN01002202.1/:145-2547(-)